MRDPAKYMNDIAAILARKADAAHHVLKESLHGVVDKAKVKVSEKVKKKINSGRRE